MAEVYKKHTHREHVLELPDTYIGSVETADETRWVYDSSTSKMVHRTLKFNPGLYKTFDELIVNARDALVRSQESTTKIKRIDVSASIVNGRFCIVVKNDGDGIPVEMHPTEKCYIPELIFGHLLSKKALRFVKKHLLSFKSFSLSLLVHLCCLQLSLGFL